MAPIHYGEVSHGAVVYSQEIGQIEKAHCEDEKNNPRHPKEAPAKPVRRRSIPQCWAVASFFLA
jgi:hypothetical protein